MRVVALKKCFHGGVRRRVGDVFDMDPPGGKLPAYVEPVQDEAAAKAKAAAAVKAEQQRQADGAKASSGGAAAKQKQKDAQDLV